MSKSPESEGSCRESGKCIHDQDNDDNSSSTLNHVPNYNNKKKKKLKNSKDQVIFEAKLDCSACKQKVQNSLVDYPGVEEIIFDENRAIVRGQGIDAKKLFGVAVPRSGHCITKLLHPEIYEKNLSGEKKEYRSKPSEDVTVMLKAKMHCGQCTRQTMKAATSLRGVYDVVVEDDIVTLKGKGLDAKQVCEDLTNKLGKFVEILSPPEKTDKKKKKSSEKRDENEHNTNPKDHETYIAPSQYNLYNYPSHYFSEDPNSCFIM